MLYSRRSATAATRLHMLLHLPDHVHIQIIVVAHGVLRSVWALDFINALFKCVCVCVCARESEGETGRCVVHTSV